MSAPAQRGRPPGADPGSGAGSGPTWRDTWFPRPERRRRADLVVVALIVVAAVGQDDQLAEFSNYGAKSVHIAAPGVKIFSTIAGGNYSDSITKFTDDTGSEKSIDWDGTSMATPIVAGAAALVWSKYPDASYKQIRARLLNSARKVASLQGKIVTGGVLDVEAALR